MTACAMGLPSRNLSILGCRLLCLLWNLRLASDASRVTGTGIDLPLKLTCWRKSEYRAKVPPAHTRRCEQRVSTMTRKRRGSDAGNLTIVLYRLLSEHRQNWYKNQIVLIGNYEYAPPDAAISNIRVFGGTFWFRNLWYIFFYISKSALMRRFVQNLSQHCNLTYCDTYCRCKHDVLWENEAASFLHLCEFLLINNKNSLIKNKFYFARYLGSLLLEKQ